VIEAFRHPNTTRDFDAAMVAQCPQIYLTKLLSLPYTTGRYLSHCELGKVLFLTSICLPNAHSGFTLHSPLNISSPITQWPTMTILTTLASFNLLHHQGADEYPFLGQPSAIRDSTAKTMRSWTIAGYDPLLGLTLGLQNSLLGYSKQQ